MALQSHWKMTDASGGIEDSVGSNNGSESGSGFTYGGDGPPQATHVTGSIAFNGSGFFDCGDVYDTPTNYTLAAWVVGTTPDKGIIGRWANNGYALIAKWGATHLPGALHDPAGAGMASGTTDILDGSTWFHVASTYDGANVRLYVNGTLEDTYAIATGPTTVAKNFMVGQYNDPNDKRWIGSIADARYYDNQLSKADIDDIIDNSDGIWPSFGNPAESVGSSVGKKVAASVVEAATLWT